MKYQFAVSITSFFIKGLCAFSIGVLVAKGFSHESFALWTIVFSIGMLVSVSDFGIGQYIITKNLSLNLGHSSKTKYTVAATQIIFCIVAFMISALSFISIYNSDSYDLKFDLILIIILRLLAIPYGAYIQSKGLYYERKLYEAMSYVIIALFFYLCNYKDDPNYTILIVNFIMTVMLLPIIYRAYHIGFPRDICCLLSKKIYINVIKNSFPYFLNNSAGLIIYGGFIFFISTFMDEKNVAYFGFLHTIIFMYVYQLYDVVFKTFQHKMVEPNYFKLIQRITFVSLIPLVVITSIVLTNLNNFGIKSYNYTIADVVFFNMFIVVEMYFLLVTVYFQTDIDKNKKLAELSIKKLLLFLVSIIIFSLSNNHHVFFVYGVISLATTVVIILNLKKR